MDADLFLVVGIVIIGFAIPSILGAFTEGRAPRTAAILVMIGGSLIALAVYQRPAAYSFQTIPDVFVRVVGQFLN